MSNKYAWDFEYTIKGRIDPQTKPYEFRRHLQMLLGAIKLVVAGVEIASANLTMHRIVHGSQTIETDLTKESQ